MKTLTIVVTALAALSTAIGETLLSYGMKQQGKVDLADPSHLPDVFLSVFHNSHILLGIVFVAVFFFLYLVVLSWADFSFVLPLTAMSYIFGVLLAKYFLKEDVTWLRWIGTIVIVIGIVLVAVDYNPRSSGTGTPQDRQSEQAP